MHIDKRIVIDDSDISTLHAEIEDIFNFFIDHSGGSDKWVKEDFPQVEKLRAMLTMMVLSEPRDRVYERMSQLEKEEQAEHNRLKKRFLKVLPKKEK
jgi:hypothetical protein